MPLHERRLHLRERLPLGLQLANGQPARVLNASAKGLYILMPPGARIDDWMAIEIVPPARLRVRALAQVLRTERIGSGTGVALRLHATRLSTLC